jgi:hypothetical protein
LPSWKDLRRFCETDGWELFKRTDHDFFRKRMPDGALKITKVSRGSGEIGPQLWRSILRKQLQVTQEYFNSKI